MHILLLEEICQDVTGNEFIKIPDFVTNSKIILIIVFTTFLLGIRYYFSTAKTDKLLKKYDEEFRENESKISLCLYYM